MESLVALHRHLAEGLLLVLIVDLLLPYLLRRGRAGMVLAARIGFFLFWALWATVVFSGVIVFVFAREEPSSGVILMIAAAILLPLLDAYRALGLGARWRKNHTGLVFSAVVLILEIVLVLATILHAVRGAG